jgi:hypothetical protein
MRWMPAYPLGLQGLVGAIQSGCLAFRVEFRGYPANSYLHPYGRRLMASVRQEDRAELSRPSQASSLLPSSNIRSGV